jgi:hypothetical protein
LDSLIWFVGHLEVSINSTSEFPLGFLTQKKKLHSETTNNRILTKYQHFLNQPCTYKSMAPSVITGSQEQWAIPQNVHEEILAKVRHKLGGYLLSKSFEKSYFEALQVVINLPGKLVPLFDPATNAFDWDDNLVRAFDENRSRISIHPNMEKLSPVRPFEVPTIVIELTEMLNSLVLESCEDAIPRAAGG